MNPTKIEWCDLTWNPITGCHHHCPFCYAERFAKRLRGRFGYPRNDPFAPTFHPRRLSEPYGSKPSRVFAVSMGDIFSPGMKRQWLDAVFDVMEAADQHTYYILTKAPAGWEQFDELPHKLWTGVSVTSQEDLKRIQDLVFFQEGWKELFVSIEPLLGPVRGLDLSGVRWVIMGAETGNRKGKVVPKLDWIIQILDEADRHDIPVFMKDSLKAIPGIETIWRRELEAAP